MISELTGNRVKLPSVILKAGLSWTTWTRLPQSQITPKAMSPNTIIPKK
jgi:hypothetical protein